MFTYKTNKNEILEFKKTIYSLNKFYVNSGFAIQDLEQSFKTTSYSVFVITFIVAIVTCIYWEGGYFITIMNYIFGVRCLVPNNYFIWEATRPISNCNFCKNLSKPILLPNVTRETFLPYSYGSKPIVIKGAFLNWPAMHTFSLEYFQQLYNNTEGSVKSVNEECQFLHFKSDFISVRDVFLMSENRSKNEPNEKSWYVGWGNCHPTILEEMRKHYPKPHFLPDDSEIPSKEYVFMGYDDGATLHLDFINRLMWQAQLKGTKFWHLHPPPECEKVCNTVSFYAEPGDAVMVDTRVWYHATTIKPGDFSISVQSEYG